MQLRLIAIVLIGLGGLFLVVLAILLEMGNLNMPLAALGIAILLAVWRNALDFIKEKKAAAIGAPANANNSPREIKKRKQAEEENARLSKALSDPGFIRWSTRFLRHLYGTHPADLVTLHGRDYAAVAYAGAPMLVYDAGSLRFPKDVLVPPQHTLRPDVRDRERDAFLSMKIKAGKVVSPEQLGFALLRMELDAQRRVRKLRTIMTNYGRTIQSCHILEFEMQREYARAEKKGRDARDDFASIARRLRQRQLYHDGSATPVDAILKPGPQSEPLLSVQAIVCYRARDLCDESQWKVLVTRRSEETAVKPGFYQFQPSGGFEVPPGADEVAGIAQFDPVMALMREYAEELFAHPAFGAKGSEVSSEDIRNHPAVVQLKTMIAAGNAWFDYLGVVVDLTLMRHELSFVITVADPEYYEKSTKLGGFKGAEAARGFESYTIAELKQLGKQHHFVASSAGMLALALGCERWKALGVVGG